MNNKVASRTSVGTWLVMLWAAAVCLVGLWRLSRWLALGMSFVVLWLWIVLSVRRRRELRRGYWVRYVHEALLDEGHGDFAVRYCEGPKEQYFYGVLGKRPHRDVLFVPSTEHWDFLVAAWVRGRRAEVLERLLADREVARCELYTVELPGVTETARAAFLRVLEAQPRKTAWRPRYSFPEALQAANSRARGRMQLDVERDYH